MFVNDKCFKEGLDILCDVFLLQNELNVVAINAKKNEYSFSDGTLTVYYKNKSSFYRLVFLWFKRQDNFYKEENGCFQKLNYMFDCSRNAVLNLSSCRRLIAYLCVLGYTGMSLYCEDTFEVDNERCFGYLRGRYSKSELREIERLCMVLGLDFFMSIQTLAHLRSIYRYEDYYVDAIDCNDVLMVDSERVDRLIENIFSSLAKTLISREINIGMDEAFMLGRGKHLNKYGYEKPEVLYFRHLKKVVKIAKKYGFSVKMWGDFFYSEHSNDNDVIEFIKDEGVEVILWEYGGSYDAVRKAEETQKDYLQVFNKRSNIPYSAYCGSDHKFLGMTTHNNVAVKIAKGILPATKDFGFKDLWLSSWGDCGSETSPFATLPVIAFYGYYKTYCKKEGFEEYFNKLFGNISLFFALDLANCLSKKLDSSYNTSSKYFLYQDVFNGVMDRSINGNYSKFYSLHLKELEECRKNIGYNFEYLFDTQISLIKVLKSKYNLGNLTREIYKNKDYNKIKSLINKYSRLITLIKAFGNSFEKQWLKDNKPFGIEIHQARIGALIYRIESCKKRLAGLKNGDHNNIEELEEEILDLFGQGKDIINLNWGELTSSGVMIEYRSFV